MLNDILNTCILLSSVVLFGLAWIKICIMDSPLNLQKVSALLFILASTSFAGRVLLPKVIVGAWFKIAILSLLVGVLLWIIGDRRRVI